MIYLLISKGHICILYLIVIASLNEERTVIMKRETLANMGRELERSKRGISGRDSFEAGFGT